MTHTWDPHAARTAGALYLSIAVCGGFSIGYVPMQIVVAGDPAASVANLIAQPGLFKLGVLADALVILFELAITAVLYHMFRSLGAKLATTALIARTGMIVVMGVNLMLWVMPYLLLQTLDPKEIEGLAHFSFAAHAMGVYVWQLFFGVHLLALGVLVLRAPQVPNLLGWGLFLGSFGYLLQGVVELTFTDVALLDYTFIGLLVIVTLSEIGFALWLLVRGGRAHPQTANAIPA